MSLRKIFALSLSALSLLLLAPAQLCSRVVFNGSEDKRFYRLVQQRSKSANLARIHKLNLKHVGKMTKAGYGLTLDES